MGLDHVTFLFSANRDIAPEPVADIASGGEVSRLMLALKALIADKRSLPTIIFDEIDTGVSGETAEYASDGSDTPTTDRSSRGRPLLYLQGAW